MSGRSQKPRWSYETARTKEEALAAARFAISCLDDIAGVDLGHDGDHLVSEARRNVRAIEGFLRGRDQKEGA